MEKLLAKKYNPAKIGFLQAAGVIIYCGLIALFFFAMTKTMNRPGFFGFFLMLLLLVFSAAVCGSLVFGYPAYLVLTKRVKESINVLAYTLLFSLLIILATIIAIFSFT